MVTAGGYKIAEIGTKSATKLKQNTLQLPSQRRLKQQTEQQNGGAPEIKIKQNKNKQQNEQSSQRK